MGKLRIRARLGTCGRCGGALGNPLRHVCVTRADRPRRRRRTRIRPRVTVTRKCGTCGKQVSNPFTHTCTVKGDFRKKLAASKRTSRPGRKPRRVTVYGADGKPRGTHLYTACRDMDCQRQACVAFREGYAAGLEAAR